MMKGRMRSALLTAFAAVFILQGCATSQIPDSKRDQTGLYDGRWHAVVQKSQAIQYIENWTFNCEANPWEFDMVINNGQVFVGGFNGEEYVATNIDSSGRFAFIIPMGRKASESGASDAALVNGTSRLFIKGNLGKSRTRGSVKVGIQQFGWQGCTTKVIYDRTSDDLSDVEI